MKEEKQELRYGKNVEWFLNELAAYEFRDLSDGEIEVYGEDASGCEGSCTVDVTDLAADAAQLISELREQLLQRDEQIAELQEDNTMLRDTRAGLSRECNAFEKQIAALTEENVSKTIRLQQLINIVEHADNRYCMCGDSMESHGSVGGCGSPTGMFDYHYGKWLETSVENPATDAAANALRAEGAIAARNALVAAENGADIYATVTAVIDQLREGKA